MDAYPFHYVSHNLPFIILFGLGTEDAATRDAFEEDYPLLKEKGIYISSDLPNVTGRTADELLNAFHELDARDAAWNNRPGTGKMGTMGFTFRSVGRAVTLPPHKANPPSSSPSPPATEDIPRKSSLTPVLHSPLSPLTPESPVFPDGIMTPFWFSKHQTLLPSTLIAFFDFTSDLNSSTLRDNKLKSEINAIRTAITASAYKFRLLVVLVAEDDDLDNNPTERLANIRRGTSLDPKSLLYLHSRPSPPEVKKFVGSVLVSIQPSCIEYYRDLSKHARRKRNRGSIPPPTAPPTYGTSQTLSAQGWNVRYETKLGCFAEFRQEMDAAGRNYEAAYESLLDGDIFETIASWSPRFDEARLLADMLVIRILRCLLWTGQTTSAVQSWSNHRLRFQELIDRKGKGTGTYGWEAWEARWSTIMAELIEKVDIPIFHVPDQLISIETSSSEIPDIYAIPEKAFSAEERLPPWDLLHHEGYWLRRAAQKTRARRKLALGIPKEDRNSPGQSPASQIASKSHLYDTYLCPEPHLEHPLAGHTGFDHGGLIVETMRKSAYHFSRRGQARAVERLEYEIGREYMRSGRWEEAMEILSPLWTKISWRRAGWWKLVEEITWAMRACARHLGEGQILVEAEWELLSSFLTPRINWQYDISKCLDGLDIEGKPQVTFDGNMFAPCLIPTIAFGSASGYAGETVEMQLVITSYAHQSSTAIMVKEFTLLFSGGVRNVRIRHDPDAMPVSQMKDEDIYLYNISLNESPFPTNVSLQNSYLAEDIGSSDLVFPPGATKVFEFAIVPRNSGEVQGAKLNLALREELFDLDVDFPLAEQVPRNDWWIASEKGLFKRKLPIENACTINILPKPPKMEFAFPNIRKTYYTGEKVEIQVDITNEEEETAKVGLEVQLIGNLDRAPVIRWDVVESVSDGDSPESALEASISQPGAIDHIQLSPSMKSSQSLTFQALPEMAEYTLEIRVKYHLLSEPDTQVSKTVTRDLVIVTPFQASYEFISHIHPDPWPSYFHVSDDEDSENAGVMAEQKPQGIIQQWLIPTTLSSLASEPLQIESLTLQLPERKHSTTTTLLPPPTPLPTPTTLTASQPLHHTFTLNLQKQSLEDRRPTPLPLSLSITWRLTPTSHPTTTTLPLPPFTAPFGEPRLLATATPSPTHAPLIHLAYTLENPSAHFLTFSLTMEGSEEFAFSGPKSMSVQLVPISRHTVRYNVLPARMGGWIRPVLRVVDVGFGKVLRVGAAGGCKGEKAGVGVRVWVGEE